MPDHRFGFDTLCLHAGQIPDARPARAHCRSPDDFVRIRRRGIRRSLFNLQNVRQRLSRHLESHGSALEERVAALEGGRAALAAATEMAAQMVVMLTLAPHGDHIVASRSL